MVYNPSWPVYHDQRPLTNAPECVPNLAPPDFLTKLGAGGILNDPATYGVVNQSVPSGAIIFVWGAYWKQAGGGQPYHEYTTDLQIPHGFVAVLLWAGFENVTDSVYDLYVDGSLHALLHDVGNYTSTYDEVNPPGATTFTGNANTIGMTDGANSGIPCFVNFRPSGLVFPPGARIRLRQRVHTALKTTNSTLFGFYARSGS